MCNITKYHNRKLCKPYNAYRKECVYDLIDFDIGKLRLPIALTGVHTPAL